MDIIEIVYEILKYVEPEQMRMIWCTSNVFFNASNLVYQDFYANRLSVFIIYSHQSAMIYIYKDEMKKCHPIDIGFDYVPPLAGGFTVAVNGIVCGAYRFKGAATALNKYIRRPIRRLHLMTADHVYEQNTSIIHAMKSRLCNAHVITQLPLLFIPKCKSIIVVCMSRMSFDKHLEKIGNEITKDNMKLCCVNHGNSEYIHDRYPRKPLYLGFNSIDETVRVNIGCSCFIVDIILL